MFVCDWQLRQPRGIEENFTPKDLIRMLNKNPAKNSKNPFILKSVDFLFKPVKYPSAGTIKGACSKGYWFCQILYQIDTRSEVPLRFL